MPVTQDRSLVLSCSPLRRGRRAASLRLMLNPAFVYAATWLFVLLLYWLRLSELLEPLQARTVTLVLGSSLAFLVGWMLEPWNTRGRLAVLNPDLSALSSALRSPSTERRLAAAWTALALGIAFEVAFFGGAPILGAVGIGPEILYTDFGIPGFHGVMNSLFYACCALQFSRILSGSSDRTIVLTLVALGYPLLGMSRQVLMSLLLQFVLIYFTFTRPSLRVFLRVGLVLVVAVLSFGYLGDIRSGREQIMTLASPTFEYPDWLPSAFIWFYIYLCTPLNNVNFNIDIDPNYLPLETAGTFIPSFAREGFLNALGSTRHWDLVTESFNVSSLLQSLLTDFGVGGAIVFTLLCGYGFSRMMRKSAKSPSALYAVIVLLHGIALSFFANLLFHLVFMFEIAAIWWILSRKRKR